MCVTATQFVRPPRTSLEPEKVQHPDDHCRDHKNQWLMQAPRQPDRQCPQRPETQPQPKSQCKVFEVVKLTCDARTLQDETARQPGDPPDTTGQQQQGSAIQDVDTAAGSVTPLSPQLVRRDQKRQRLHARHARADRHAKKVQPIQNARCHEQGGHNSDRQGRSGRGRGGLAPRRGWSGRGGRRFGVFGHVRAPRANFEVPGQVTSAEQVQPSYD